MVESSGDFLKKLDMTEGRGTGIPIIRREMTKNSSPEHNQKFTAVDVNLKIEKEPDDQNKLRLNLNGMDILEWFKEKYQKVQQKTEVNTKQPQRNKGFSL